MVPPSDDDDPRPLVERIGERLGVDVDPRVSLDASTLSPAASDAGAGDPPSSGLLGRLASRPVVSGRYRVDGEIARGGMGAILDVWDHDVRRHLAMKVALRRDGDGSSDTGGRSDELDPRMLARFLEEAQVTGQLEHPGIVPVHEFGMDDNGQVFFTMRRVRGHDLERVFAQLERGEGDWTLPRVVGVLLKVCEAMAYAHSKGVVHRDLKPANVMVGAFGEVYVMDWGLVRVQGLEDRHDLRVEVDPRELPGGEDSDALYTMDGDVLGTPAYMSPEQARGEVMSLDARSDVYAMGAILYRLLARHPPYYDGGRIGGYALLTALRDGPPKALASVAPDAAPELVAIADKAMARERGDRYASMVELEQDLRAFLEQRVVAAYETGAWAETRKWVRRNRPLAASLLAVLVALAVGLGVSLVEKRRADDNAALAQRNEQAAKAAAAEADEQRARAVEAAAATEEQRVRAVEAAAEAERQARIAEEVNAFLNDDLLMAVAPDVVGRDVTVREVLDAAALRLDGRFGDEPLVEAELRHTIADARWMLGRYQEALPSYERALELRRATLGDEAAPTLESTFGLATCLDDVGRTEEAIALFETFRPRAEEVYGPSSGQVLSLLANLGSAKLNLGLVDESIVVLEEARDLADGLFVPVEDELSVIGNLALAYREAGRLHDARELQERALEMQRVVNGPEHPETLTAMSNLATTTVDLGEYARARELGEELVEQRRRVLGPDHVQTGQELYNLGVTYRELGEFETAERLVREGAEVLAAELGDVHWRVLRAEDNLATVLNDLGRRDESLALHEAVLERAIPNLGVEHPVTMTCLANLAILSLQMGRLADSKQAHEALLVVERRVRGSDHPTTLTTLENYGNVLYSMNDYDGAFEALEEVYAGRRRALGERHPDVAKTAMNFAMVTRYAGQPELARERFEQAIERWRDATAMHDGYYVDCLRHAGELARDAGDHEVALERFTEAAERLEAYPPSELLGDILHAAGLAAWKVGDYELGERLARRAVAVHTETIGPDALDTLTSEFAYAGHVRRLGRVEEAERLVLDYVERMSAVHGADHPNLRHAREALVLIYEELGRPDEADRWRD